jgi:hypothetical protein
MHYRYHTSSNTTYLFDFLLNNFNSNKFNRNRNCQKHLLRWMLLLNYLYGSFDFEHSKSDLENFNVVKIVSVTKQNKTYKRNINWYFVGLTRVFQLKFSGVGPIIRNFMSRPSHVIWHSTSQFKNQIMKLISI